MRHALVDQYTKLSIWTLYQIGIKIAVYFGADAIVRRNSDELRNLPFGFGAVPDIWVETLGSRQIRTLEFSSSILDKDLRGYGVQLETTDFGLKDAEQSYLNHYSASCRLWREPCDLRAVAGDMEGDAVGYEGRPSYRRQAPQLGNEVPERGVRLDTGVQRRETGEYFAPELAWWKESFNLAMGEIGKCPASLR